MSALSENGEGGRTILAHAAGFAVVTGLLFLGLAGCGGLGERGEAQRAASENSRLGLGYMGQGDYERAEEVLLRALDHDPDHVDAHHYLGELYRRQGEFTRGQGHYQQALRQDGDDPALRNNYGILLCSMGEADAATRAFRRAAADRSYGLRVQALENAAECHLGLGDPGEAVQLYRDALELAPRRESLAIGLARAHHMNGDPRAAETAFMRYADDQDELSDDARALQADIAAALEENR